MATSASQLGQPQFISGGRFSPDALETNRTGRLTDVQRQQLTAVDRGFRKGMIGFAGMCALIGVILLTATGPAPNAWLRPIAGVGLLVLAGALVFYYLPGGDRLTQDLRRGQVLMLEGAMEKHVLRTSSGSARTLHTYYLDVKDQHFEVTPSEYEAAPTAGWVRVYYLPQTRKAVNLERLPDPPLPAGLAQPTMASLGAVMKEAFRGHGEARHEAAAEIEQMGAAMRAVRADGAVPPPAGARDPRPLADAIVGTWRGGPFSVEFRGDGTVTMQPLMGHAQEGHWSVDAQGRLHADAFGREQTGDAWVQGDTLTISVNGEGIKLQRAG